MSCPAITFLFFSGYKATNESGAYYFCPTELKISYQKKLAVYLPAFCGS